VRHRGRQAVEVAHAACAGGKARGGRVQFRLGFALPGSQRPRPARSRPPLRAAAWPLRTAPPTPAARPHLRWGRSTTAARGGRCR
jgi:hypothetical protein